MFKADVIGAQTTPCDVFGGVDTRAATAAAAATSAMLVQGGRCVCALHILHHAGVCVQGSLPIERRGRTAVSIWLVRNQWCDNLAPKIFAKKKKDGHNRPSWQIRGVVGKGPICRVPTKDARDPCCRVSSGACGWRTIMQATCGLNRRHRRGL